MTAKNKSTSRSTATSTAAKTTSTAKPRATPSPAKSPVKNDAEYLLLKSNLKQLRLPTMKAEFEQLAREAAQSSQTFEQYLLRLTELEVSARASNTLNSRIKQAQFPVQKDLDSYDFSALPSLNKQKVLELARGDWIAQHANVCLLGQPGTGKPRPLEYSSGYGGVRGRDSGHRSVSSVVWADFSAAGDGPAARISAALSG